MNRCFCCLSILTLSLVLYFSCNRPSELPYAKLDPSREAVLRDSIRTLDSLVTVYKIRNPRLAKNHAYDALSLAIKSNDPLLLARAYRLVGYSMINTNEDSSFIYYNRGLQIADSFDLVDEKSHLYYNVAVVYQEAQDYQTALSFFDSARRMFAKNGDFANLSSAYCAIANIKHDLFDFTGARQAYDTALSIAVDNGFSKQKGVALANLIKYVENNDTVIRMQKEAINCLEKSSGNEEEIATVLMNIGNYFTNPDSALDYYLEAITLGETYFLNEVMIGVYNNMAYSFLEKGDVVQAEGCLKDHAIPLAQADSNFDWLSTLYDSYADVFVAKGKFKDAFLYERKALEAKAEFDIRRAAGQVRLLAALLDLKNKELMIQAKSKQVLAEENRSKQILLWLIIAIVVSIGLGVLVFILSQRHRLKMQRQKLDSATRILRMEEQEKERVGRELHDLTGQVILGIAGELDQARFSDPVQQEQLQKRVREIGNGIREISHRMAKPGMHHLSFQELVADLCESYRKSLGMNIGLKIHSDLPDIPYETAMHLYRVIQELLTNAGKYAREYVVALTVNYEGKMLEIFYSDEGPGFDPALSVNKGMGLSIIFERIKLIDGDASLDSSPGVGTFWEIKVPINHTTK